MTLRRRLLGVQHKRDLSAVMQPSLGHQEIHVTCWLRT
jgi:hypothetical protein